MYLGAMAGSYEGELPPPSTRSLKWMAKILGQDVETEPVQSPEEAYLKKIAESGGGGGGSNPNARTDVNGTLAAPWGNLDAGTLYSQMIGGEAEVYLTVDASALSAGTIVLRPSITSGFWYFSTANNGSNGWEAAVAGYSELSPHALHDAYSLQGGNTVNLAQYAAALPTVLTVIYHPMTGTLSPAESETFGGAS
jgi:hypothetical protein